MDSKLGIHLETNSYAKFPNCIDPFSENNVRIDLGYTITEWDALSKEDRAREVALHTINKMIEYKVYEKQEQMAKRK